MFHHLVFGNMAPSGFFLPCVICRTDKATAPVGNLTLIVLQACSGIRAHLRAHLLADRLR